MMPNLVRYCFLFLMLTPCQMGWSQIQSASEDQFAAHPGTNWHRPFIIEPDGNIGYQ